MSRRFQLVCFFGVLIWGMLFCQPCAAQKSPQLGYVYPPAVQAGSTSQVQIGGYDFTPDLQWFEYSPYVTIVSTGILGDYQITPPPYWSGPRAGVASMPIAREVPVQLSVDANALDGLAHVQVANANGSSQLATFLVSNLEQVVENRSRDLEQRLESIPIGVSGRLSRLTEVDRYRFTARNDGLIHVELFARRVGADFNAIMQIHDAQGNMIADSADTLGTDRKLVFPAKVGDEFVVSLFDADFRGDPSYIYQMSIEDGAQIQRTFPERIGKGIKQVVEFAGWGFVTGGVALESLQQEILVPAEHTEDHWDVVLKTAVGEIVYPLPVHSSTSASSPTILSIDEKTGKDDGRISTGDFVLSRQFQANESEHRYRWECPKDSVWNVELEAWRFASSLDLELSVLDSTGKLLINNDDVSGSTDAGLIFRTEADGEYQLVARRISHSSETMGNRYVLRASRQTPDYRLIVPQKLDIPLGGKSEWSVRAERFGGHSEEIHLEVKGLPAGVTVQGELKIATGANQVTWQVESANTSAVVAAPICVIGESPVNGITQRRQAVAPIATSRAPMKPSERQLDVALATITMTPPFEIKLLDKTRQRDTPRGATCVAEMDIVRKEGFSGEILLEMASQQSRYLCGSYGNSVLVPANVSRVEYGAWMSEWLATEFTMRMATHGVGKVPDPQGNIRYLVKATDAPITMIMEGALLKVTSPHSLYYCLAGESCKIPLRISRSPKLAEAVQITAEIPTELRGLIEISPVALETSQEMIELELKSINSPSLIGKWTIPIRASTLVSSRWLVQSTTEISVTFTADDDHTKTGN